MAISLCPAPAWRALPAGVFASDFEQRMTPEHQYRAVEPATGIAIDLIVDAIDRGAGTVVFALCFDAPRITVLLQVSRDRAAVETLEIAGPALQQCAVE